MKSSSKVKKISVQKLSVFGTFLLIVSSLIYFYLNPFFYLSEEHLNCTAKTLDIDWNGKKSLNNNLNTLTYYSIGGMYAEVGDKKSFHIYKQANFRELKSYYFVRVEEHGGFFDCKYNNNVTLLTCDDEDKVRGTGAKYYFEYDRTTKSIETYVDINNSSNGILVEYVCN